MKSLPTQYHMDGLDPEVCRQARLSRDSRFDGEFFLAVSTTGIYCRPVCPARSPAEKNVRYFRHAAQAAASGFRPCLRCRPESAPNSPAWCGTTTTVQRALTLIGSGALNDGSLAQLAGRLGVGERYLRKLFERELGLSPLDVAQNQRLLFAKKLLVETQLTMTEVAFAAGFSSVRRFNSAIRASFDTTPGALRKQRASPACAGAICLTLHYRPPYDWDGVIDFFARHALAGIEQVSAQRYHRNIRLHGQSGSMTVTHLPQRNALQLELTLPDHRRLMTVVARVRRMFDLDANPDVIRSVLVQNPVLEHLLEQFPGIRSPVQWSVPEITVRAIVGQQVSIAAARGVCSRLAIAAAGAEDEGFFPDPAAIAALPDEHFAMPGRRRDTLRAVCRAYAEANEDLPLEALAAIKGIGPWTTGVVAMRGWGDPDVFPPGDLGLVRAYEALAKDDDTLTRQLEHWRPWRSYAANLLWRSFCL